MKALWMFTIVVGGFAELAAYADEASPALKLSVDFQIEPALVVGKTPLTLYADGNCAKSIASLPTGAAVTVDRGHGDWTQTWTWQGDRFAPPRGTVYGVEATCAEYAGKAFVNASDTELGYAVIATPRCGTSGNVSIQAVGLFATGADVPLSSTLCSRGEPSASLTLVQNAKIHPARDLRVSDELRRDRVETAKRGLTKCSVVWSPDGHAFYAQPIEGQGEPDSQVPRAKPEHKEPEKVKVKCSACKGTGVGGDKCASCGGKGTTIDLTGGFPGRAVKCTRCNGSGREPGTKCPSCGGRGYWLRNKSDLPGNSDSESHRQAAELRLGEPSELADGDPRAEALRHVLQKAGPTPGGK